MHSLHWKFAVVVNVNTHEWEQIQKENRNPVNGLGAWNVQTAIHHTNMYNLIYKFCVQGEDFGGYFNNISIPLSKSLFTHLLLKKCVQNLRIKQVADLLGMASEE